MSSRTRTMSTSDPDNLVLTSETITSGARPLFAARRRLVWTSSMVLLLVGPATVLLIGGPSVATTPPASSGTLEVSEDIPSVQLMYYSDWNLTPTPVHSGARLAGDHIVLMSSWSPAPSIIKSRIEVTAPALSTTIYQESSTASVQIDTRALNNNATCTVNMTAWVAGDSATTVQVTNVFLGNFFSPKVTVVSPNGGEVCTGVCAINWIAWDKNSDDELTYEVLLSADSGVSFQLIAADLGVTVFEWNCTGFLLLDTYVVQVRVSDGIYTSSDRSDAPFTAGTVPVTSTLTTTSTTDSSIDTTAVYLGATLLISVVMALLVYIAAKRWL